VSCSLCFAELRDYCFVIHVVTASIQENKSKIHSIRVQISVEPNLFVSRKMSYRKTTDKKVVTTKSVKKDAVAKNPATLKTKPKLVGRLFLLPSDTRLNINSLIFMSR
jgi:hypothetical protein